RQGRHARRPLRARPAAAPAGTPRGAAARRPGADRGLALGRGRRARAVAAVAWGAGDRRRGGWRGERQPVPAAGARGGARRRRAGRRRQPLPRRPGRARLRGRRWLRHARRARRRPVVGAHRGQGPPRAPGGPRRRPRPRRGAHLLRRAGRRAVSEAYPPERHLLRDLDVEVEVVAEGRRSAVFRPGGGTHVELGAVLTILDLVAGSLCLEVVSPDWIATSGITFHLTRPLLAGELQLEGHLLRAGRTTTTVELRAVDRVSTQLLGEGVATFARTRRSATAPDQPPPTEPGSRFSFTDPNGAALGADGTLRD